MPESAPHRKSVKHYERLLQARLLTFSCFERRPILLEGVRPAIVAEALERAVLEKQWVLLAWVFMPEHVHILVVPWYGADDVSALLYAIKRPSSFRIKRSLVAARDPLLDTLTVRERPGKTAFRFWQEGPGHDRNIRSYEGIVNAVRYVHENPLRRGLCEQPGDWEWSSARQWETGEKGTPRVVRWSPNAGLVWEGPGVWFGPREVEQV